MESQNDNGGINEPEEPKLEEILARNKQLIERDKTEYVKLKAMLDQAEKLLAKHKKIEQEKSPLGLFNMPFDE